MIDLYWPEGQTLPTVQSSKYLVGSLNFILRIEMGLTLCVGLKGVLSVSVTGLGFLEFHIRLGLGGFIDTDHWDPGQADPTAKFILYGGAAFRVVLEILYSLGFDNGHEGTRVYAENVVSITRRQGAAGDQRQMIFLVQKNAGDEGCTLKALCPDPNTSTKYWTIWDYGVSVPAVQIYQASLYGRECVYWAETAGETEDGTGQLFKVRGVWYDSASNTLSDAFTLAAIQAPLGSAPSDIILNGNDRGYYVLEQVDGRRTVHRFNFQLVLGVKLVGNMLSENLVTPGTYDEMLLTVYNNGNVPLSGLDLTAYDVKQGGTPQAFEAIHLDVLNPQNSRITLKKGLEGDTEVKQGVTVARQEESSLNDPDAVYWLVKGATYRGYLRNLQQETSSLQKSDLIMPGAFSAFHISLLVPQGWSDTHEIYLQVETMYTTADSAFSSDVNAPPLLNARRAAPAVIAVSREGDVRREGGGLLRAAISDAELSAMFKQDLTFDRIQLGYDPVDLEIQARRWDDSDGTPMVTLTVNNQAYIAGGAENVVVMEAFLDDEATPVFRYSLPQEVSDKQTWNFDLPLVKETTDEIARRYGEGQSFDSLIRQYGQAAGADAGAELLFHPDSESWAPAFREQVMALEKPGELTGPFVTSLGIHMVLYVRDLPSGVHQLTEEEQQALAASALEHKQLNILQGFLEQWKNQYKIETHPEMLW